MWWPHLLQRKLEISGNGKLLKPDALAFSSIVAACCFIHCESLAHCSTLLHSSAAIFHFPTVTLHGMDNHVGLVWKVSWKVRDKARNEKNKCWYGNCRNVVAKFSLSVKYASISWRKKCSVFKSANEVFVCHTGPLQVPISGRVMSQYCTYWYMVTLKETVFLPPDWPWKLSSVNRFNRFSNCFPNCSI